MGSQKLEKEMKSPFAGLKDILSGSKEESEEKTPLRYPKGKKPPVPVRGAPRPQKPPAMRGRPAKKKDEDLKKEIDKETSKLESFLSDILASSSKEGEEKAKTTLPKRQPRGLPAVEDLIGDLRRDCTAGDHFARHMQGLR